MKPINIFKRFAGKESDTEELTFSKNLILTLAILCCISGLMWGTLYYWFLGKGITMLLPYLFVLIVGITIPIAHYMKNHLILVYSELISITWITAFIQWSIGSVHESGIVIIWSFLGPIGALLFLGRRQAFFWMLQFLVIVVISILIEPKLSNDALGASDMFRNTFYLMNLCVPPLVVFGASLYFVTDIINQKNMNLSLLKSTRKKQKQILDSINYAKKIQKAIMPTDNKVKELIPNGFVLYKPKGIVSGDFYWINKNSNSNLYIAACDCTGHGVPGALVSVICNAALNRSINQFNLKKTGDILDKTRELVIKEFEKSEDGIKDGMDIALVCINEKIITFSGAYNPLWIIRSKLKILEEIKGCRQPIGNYKKPFPFLTHEVELNEGDCIYIFTDGYVDQFGGHNETKFMKKAFKKLLLSIHEKPMNEQKQKLEEVIENWKGKLDQIDDICVIGLRI